MAYTLPSNVCWHNGGTTGGWSTSTANIRLNEGTQRDWHIMWYSQYYTFQVQYRERRRLSPAKATAVYGSSGEQWTDWSEWTWCDAPTGETAGDTVRTDTVRTNMGFSYTVQEFDFPLDFGDYDAIEYEARVRVINEDPVGYSEWQTATLRVSYEPPISVTAEQTDTGLTVTLTTAWQRGGTVKLYAGQDLGEHVIETRLTKTVTGESTGELIEVTDESTGELIEVYSGNVTVDIPASAVSYLRDTSKTLKISGNSVFAPHGGSSFCFSQQDISSIPFAAHANPSTVPELHISMTSDERVSVVDSGYTSVYMYASWEDDEGNAYSSELDVTHESGQPWYGSLECAPYDSDVYVRCVGVTSKGWTQDTTVLTIPSHSRFTITNDTGSASIVLLDTDSPLSLDEDLATETAKPFGANRAHSAYSEGGERAISLSGVVLRGGVENKRSQTTHKNLLAVLRHKGDSWLRTPGGGRFRVAIKSFSLSVHGRFETVSVDMEEVE
jgi:hypothetical protein